MYGRREAKEVGKGEKWREAKGEAKGVGKGEGKWGKERGSGEERENGERRGVRKGRGREGEKDRMSGEEQARKGEERTGRE